MCLAAMRSPRVWTRGHPQELSQERPQDHHGLCHHAEALQRHG